MRERKASKTAIGVAVMRAVESSRQPENRVCFDPLARTLVDPFALLFGSIVLKLGIYNLLARGAYEYIVGRERYVDDFIEQRLQEGATQVVILGAGLDSRPYRLPALKDCSIFEVDHPSTQACKLKALKKALPGMPSNIVFVPVDFDKQSLQERLLASGYDKAALTVFVWQGVCMYLSDTGVDNTLAFIVNHAREGSSIIFDYCYASALRPDSGSELSRVRKLTGWLGEKMTFGIDKENLIDFLTARGFCQIKSADNTELKKLYFSQRKRQGPGDGIAIASARVK